MKDLKKLELQKILTICTTFNSFIKIKDVKKDEIIFGTYGIHPHEAKNDKVTSELIIDEITKNKKIIGIGETGLDFFYNHSDKKDQIRSLEEHIKAAIKLKIPLVIHSRNAEVETLEIFKIQKRKIKNINALFDDQKNLLKNYLILILIFLQVAL